VLAAHHRMASQPMYQPGNPPSRNNEWAVAHVAFHAKLIEACGSPILLGICARLSDAAELYRAWSGVWTEGRGPARRDVAAEHLALMEAALAYDATWPSSCSRTTSTAPRPSSPIPASSGHMTPPRVPRTPRAIDLHTHFLPERYRVQLALFSALRLAGTAPPGGPGRPFRA
jgi:hypothetical protein